jgi:hypothetical protein
MFENLFSDTKAINTSKETQKKIMFEGLFDANTTTSQNKPQLTDTKGLALDMSGTFPTKTTTTAGVPQKSMTFEVGKGTLPATPYIDREGKIQFSTGVTGLQAKQKVEELAAPQPEHETTSIKVPLFTNLFKKELEIPKIPVVSDIAKFTIELPEAIRNDIVDAYDVATKGDIVRKPGEIYRVPSFIDTAGQFYNYSKSQGLGDNYSKTLATIYGTSQGLLDFGIAADVASKSVLKLSGYSKPVDDALIRLNLENQDFTIDKWMANSRIAAKNIATTGDTVAARQLLVDTQVISEAAANSGISEAKGIGRIVQDVAKQIQKPLGEGRIVKYDLSVEPAGALPGYRPITPQPAFGLSIEPVEPVGRVNAKEEFKAEKGIIPQKSQILTVYQENLVDTEKSKLQQAGNEIVNVRKVVDEVSTKNNFNYSSRSPTPRPRSKD